MSLSFLAISLMRIFLFDLGLRVGGVGRCCTRKTALINMVFNRFRWIMLFILVLSSSFLFFLVVVEK